ncbi:MAG: CYTH domain-containing protein [Oscillospiraceae bacterium]|nr:CYTH domain-containing protein [Oscillospiraceae bacterium]
MGIEFELKFSAEAEQQAAIKAAYPLAYRTTEMETTYYDTADGKLSQRRITLRRRMENDISVCTVKTPVSGYGRGEWECQCGDIETGILKLCELGAPRELLLLTAEGVVPVCGAKFTRLSAAVQHNGAVLELALDRGILMGGGRQENLCEVEVELKSGEPDEAVDFGGALAQRFSLKPQSTSKFRRALALAKGE